MKFSSIFLFVIISGFASAQTFTKSDTLKGSDTDFRNFWDVKKYEVSVTPKFSDKSINGTNKISFEITKDIENPTFQIDLKQPMNYEILASDIKFKNEKRDGDFIFLETNQNFKKGQKFSVIFKFYGNPIVAVKPPWDGGWVFTEDKNKNPWMSVADEGIGASVWLPTKDIWNDEPDNGLILKIKTPKDLVGVGNGKLISTVSEGDSKVYTWEVKNPINDYSIIPNVGKYVNFKDTFNGEKGKLNLDYWVLDYNLGQAKKQFEQVKPMLKAFEYWFGPYPFYEDSYKLVESPYLGMEHQSSVAYGNRYENGYLGRDLSGTGVGLNWDFIIIHESGHEWFANNITAKDQADMWIHESFTCYSETLFTQNFMGKEAAEKYVIGLRKNIQNDEPIIGKFGVRNEGSGDMYYKGANMLHTIRQVINDDEKFRQILRGLNKDFYHQTVTGKQVEDYINQKSEIDFSSVFKQYLETTKIPTLGYYQNGKELQIIWKNTVDNFSLPIRINNGGKLIIIKPSNKTQFLKLENEQAISFDPNYYINYEVIEPQAN
ncbi:M1 family metallopeptidase [Halpernia frigidisoli]|uniref:Peptidase family M1 n=1 Tax=Halpernia frigidisoli TaxID=1125876 RepID=A0A1I3F4X5_9FLAO|nr:M1 family metallopeptidase [Halpernia frigidisoli]SFI06254.1 Peptidase family M1 [Halpernia frigidisoli]